MAKQRTPPRSKPASETKRAPRTKPAVESEPAATVEPTANSAPSEKPTKKSAARPRSVSTPRERKPPSRIKIDTMVSLLAPPDAEVVYLPDDRDAQDAMRSARYVAPPPIELGELVEAKLRQELGADYREPVEAPKTSANVVSAPVVPPEPAEAPSTTRRERGSTPRRRR